MVAKSYQNLPTLCEPYEISGKMYIKVQMKSGVEKQVRWYSDKEYAKMYPGEKVIAAAGSTDPFRKTQKEILGFEKGYITIFKGDTYSQLDWFRQSIARYAKWWGWYIISTDEVPDDLPEGIAGVRLPWEIVGQTDGTLKSESAIKIAVENLLYEPSSSEWVGSIGERLELTLTVTAVRELENGFGSSTMHIMEDECGNVFVWTTSAKNWSVGTVKTLRGTVKEHSIFHNTKQTILTRCAER